MTFEATRPGLRSLMDSIALSLGGRHAKALFTQAPM
jgi:hypothetical protein